MGALISVPMLEEWYPLKCPCPSGCGNPKVIDWTRKCCDSPLLINSDAYVKCSCKQPSPMADSNWKCGNHDGMKAKDNASLSDALTVAAKVGKEAGDGVWAWKLYATSYRYRSA